MLLNSILAVQTNSSPAWVALDIIVTLAVAVMMFVFFAKRNSYRLAVIVSIYSLVYLAILILNIYYSQAQIAIDVLRYFNIFWIVAMVDVYRSDLKVFMSKLARRQKVKYNYNTTDEQLLISATEIVKACQNMAKNDVGALIIIAPTEVPAHFWKAYSTPKLLCTTAQ